MKRAYVVIGLGGVIGLGFLLFGGGTIEVKNEPQTLATSTSAVEEPSPAELMEVATQKLIDEAIMASSTEIKAAQMLAATEIEVKMERDIERTVRANIKEDNDTRLIEIDKESGAY